MNAIACDTMDKLMNSKEPNTKQKDVPELRQYIAAQLLAGKLFDQPSEKVL